MCTGDSIEILALDFERIFDEVFFSFNLTPVHCANDVTSIFVNLDNSYIIKNVFYVCVSVYLSSGPPSDFHFKLEINLSIRRFAIIKVRIFGVSKIFELLFIRCS